MPFNGTIEDESLNANVFTNSGVTLGNGQNGSNANVALFDGSSYLELSGPIDTGQKQMTFAFWAANKSNMLKT